MAQNGHSDTPPMEYRRLGSSGLKVSVLSFGSWVTFSWNGQVGLKDATALMKQAYEAGCNFFDNAETYAAGEAEEIMGQAIKDLGWARKDYVISTKIYWGKGGGPNDRGLSRKHIIEGTKASLKRLQHDYVDLIFCHRPDPETPIEETVRAMNWVVDQGLAFEWGTSMWSAEQIREAWGIANRLGMKGPQMEQPQYHLNYREKIESEYLGLYKDFGLGTTIWSPLASGLLSGKYGKDSIPEGSRLALDKYKGFQSGITDDLLSKVDKLKEVAKSLDCTLPQLAIAWCAKNPNVSTVITGATKPEQVADNFASLKVLPKLTPEVMQKIDDIMQNKPAGPKTERF